MPGAAAAPPRRKARRVVMRSASLIFLWAYPRACPQRPARRYQRARRTIRSHGLDAGLCDDVTPFRHLVLDALLHAVGAVGDDFEAVVAQLLGDVRTLQNFDRLGGEQVDDGRRRL